MYQLQAKNNSQLNKYFSIKDLSSSESPFDATQLADKEHRFREARPAAKTRSVSASYMALELLPAAVVVIDEIGLIEFANQEAARLTLFPVHELIGLPFSALFSDIEEASDNTGPEENKLSACALRKDGARFQVEISQRQTIEGTRPKITAVLRKISLGESYARAQREYTAKIVHELKTPLACIDGVMSLMEENLLGELNEKGQAMSSQIKRTCKRMARLINDMLDLEKIQAGKFALDRKELCLKAVFDQVLALLGPIAGTRILKVRGAELICFADEDRLIQILFNLLSNAIKNSADGSCIQIKAEKSGNAVKLSVIDQGRGIPEAELERVFEVFEQQDMLDAKKGGTGLGLAICKAIVQEHGGLIGVESRVGKGSCFWLTVPNAA